MFHFKLLKIVLCINREKSSFSVITLSSSLLNLVTFAETPSKADCKSSTYGFKGAILLSSDICPRAISFSVLNTSVAFWLGLVVGASDEICIWQKKFLNYYNFLEKTILFCIKYQKNRHLPGLPIWILKTYKNMKNAFL